MATQLGNMPVGSTVYLNENGSPVPYLIVHQGLPSSIYDASCNGTWLLREDVITNLIWDSNNDNIIEESNIQSWLEKTMLGYYSQAIQGIIKQVKIPYRKNGGSGGINQTGANGLSTKVFLLSGYEVGWTNSINQNFPSDGSKLSYFESGTASAANTKRKAKFNGSSSLWWLRSPYISNDYEAWYVSGTGEYGQMSTGSTTGVRPNIIMPPNLIVDNSGNVTSNAAPTPPVSITVPTSALPTGSSIEVSWPVASGATSYTLQRSVNGGSWQTVQTGAATSFSDVAQSTWTQVQYQVCATAYGVNSAYISSSVVTILPYTITSLLVPSLIMAGQDIPISWSPVSGATNYILERNADSGGWEQIYSGPNTSFMDTPGDWTSVQYQVKAGANDVYGAYYTSEAIPIISASALVISGTDSDLGTLTADVPYTVSSDTGNPITLTRKVNGILVATLTVQSGFAYTIPVMDLPTGSGTIEIDASVNSTSGGTVTATRTWTYTKTAITFPSAGGVAPLTLNGQNVFPVAVAEGVRVPTVWGGSLDKALEQLLPVVNSAVISAGTYEGTGTFGADNPNTLTFDDTPLVVTIYGAGQTLVISSTDTSSPAYISGNQAKWYSTESAAAQMNTDGVTYSYVAVGKQV